MADLRWVRVDAGAEIAYAVAGAGPVVLVQPDWLTSLEVDESYWRPREFFERLSRFARVVRIDARGVGLSDSVAASDLPTLEEIADDTVAVLDAIGAEDVVVVASGEGGLLGTTFAATHPDRVRGLVLVNAFARFCSSSDYPVGPPREMVEAALVEAKQRWGTGYSADFWNPDLATDPEYVAWLTRWQRSAAGPSVAFALFRLMYLDLDVRPALPAVHTPTLVLHRERCVAIPPGHGEYLARHLANSDLRLLPGADGLMWGIGADDVVAEIAAFVTGSRAILEPDRVLAAVLFTDIVDSTASAARVGDVEWRRVLDRHDAAARREIERFRGTLVKSTGDGVLAMFDGPARAVRCAAAIRDAMRVHGLPIRAGIHVGEVERRGEDIGGIAVHIAARVQSCADADEILVSRTVTDLVAGSGLGFRESGTHTLKGVPGEWVLFEVTSV